MMHGKDDANCNTKSGGQHGRQGKGDLISPFLKFAETGEKNQHLIKAFPKTVTPGDDGGPVAMRGP